MQKTKRIISVCLVLCMVCLMCVGCSSDDSNASGASVAKVYYLNFKPEQAQDWEKLASVYTDETGVEVTVVTAASDTYESTLNL